MKEAKVLSGRDLRCHRGGRQGAGGGKVGKRAVRKGVIVLSTATNAEHELKRTCNLKIGGQNLRDFEEGLWRDLLRSIFRLPWGGPLQSVTEVRG